MTIELVGPKAVGKTTLGPLVAERLGSEHHYGNAPLGPRGQRVSRIRKHVALLTALVSQPTLFRHAMKVEATNLKSRLVFAGNICRRNAQARRIRAECAVISGGVVHALCQEVEMCGRDATSLSAHVHHSQMYVVLTLPTAEVVRRFSSRHERLGRGPDRRDSFLLDAEMHQDAVARYVNAAVEVLSRIDVPVIWVGAEGTPGQVADRVVAEISKRSRQP
jgi:hypothetical protein